MYKNLESWFVTKYPDGIYTLTFNLKTNCLVDDLNHYQYTFEETEPMEDWITVPEFLPEIEGHYLRSRVDEKEQVTFVFTPVLKEWYKNKQIETIDKSWK